MNLDFHLDGRIAALTGEQAGEQLEWLGLRARFAAAYAARQALVSAAPVDTKMAETPVDGGSFDRGSARTLALYGIGQGCGLGGVNPTGLANCNSGRDNDAAASTANVTGDRG